MIAINPQSIKSLIERKLGESDCESVYIFLVGRDSLQFSRNRKESMPIYEVTTTITIEENPLIRIKHKRRYPKGYYIEEYLVNINHITHIVTKSEFRDSKEESL
jgi:hypothetical protein